MDKVAWIVGLPLIRVTVDGTLKVLQYLGAIGEVSKPATFYPVTLTLTVVHLTLVSVLLYP